MVSMMLHQFLITKGICCFSRCLCFCELIGPRFMSSCFCGVCRCAVSDTAGCLHLRPSNESRNNGVVETGVTRTASPVFCGSLSHLLQNDNLKSFVFLTVAVSFASTGEHKRQCQMGTCASATEHAGTCAFEGWNTPDGRWVVLAKVARQKLTLQPQTSNFVL